MAAVAMKHMASNFIKLDKFEMVNFKRWQKKMHFLFSSMSVGYVLTTPIPEDDDATVEQLRKRAKIYGCRAVVRLPDPKLKTLSERGIECIFVRYVEHSKAFRDKVSEQHSCYFNVKDDPKTFDEAMKSQDVAFWKEAINDDIYSIIGINNWMLADLPSGFKPLGCKWIFKRKLKVDGTVEKFKATLVIQYFKQNSRIDYFDTYTLVACISTIRLLIAMTSIYNLIIHQMDVKTAFLNGELEEETTKEDALLALHQSVGYVPTTLIPDDDDDATVEQLRKRAK
nr:zinc finger, CCHC-type [Tanacetum cinerariifolium]